MRRRRLMMRIVVRSKKDADAVRAMLSQALPSWNAEVVTLKGARKEKILDVINDVVDPDAFNIVLLGREDSEVIRELTETTPPNVIVHLVPRARVRNARLSHLRWELERAKAQPRGWVRWSGEVPYLEKKFPARVEPGEEPFLAWGLWWKTLGLGEPSEKSFLVFKRQKGFHEVYSEGRTVAMFEMNDFAYPKVTKLGEVKGFDIMKSVEMSEGVLEVWEKVSSKVLEGCERAVVPWSGGKDSTAALLIAKRACDEVTAVYVDTGVDMYLNRKYVELWSQKLNVDLIIKEVPVKSQIFQRGLPTKEDRWCTALKLKGLEEAIREVKPDYIVVGDRDAESQARSARWEERAWEGVGTVKAPLKLWSAMMVQLYLFKNKVFPNPLYASGFYRLGCYVCPFFRAYERELVRRVPPAKLGTDEELLKKFLEG
ncbi:phosphoadenosine phosphosulfate reductase family protein [Ignicoccus hospitalis]|nr:phosphoadenosine phosphosulfate reductase family protein [Ignicoccus hospitalis]HIH90379.1 phosphoadenosine phosphosulfate reductase family protein [Desulfurococcaceae archaeon]